MDIFENGRKIGILQSEREGLYTTLTCKTEPGKAIRRLYLAYPYASQYLGIPNEQGELVRRVASKHIPKEFYAVATGQRDLTYLPWRGMLDGVMIEDGLIGPQELLIAAEEMMNFPGWQLEIRKYNDREMAAIPLNREGLPQPREREITENEALFFDDSDYGLPSELLADDGTGSEEFEADRPDL